MNKLSITEKIGLGIIVLSLGTGMYFFKETDQINKETYQIDQRIQAAKAEIATKKDKLKSESTSKIHHAEDKKIKAINKQDNAQINCVIAAVQNMLTKFYNYKNGNEYLARKKKFETIFSPELLSDEDLFPQKDYLIAQIRNQKLTGLYKDSDIQVGNINGTNVNFATSVTYEMTKNDKYTSTVTDQYSGIYDIKHKKFTKLTRIGRISESMEKQ